MSFPWDNPMVLWAGNCALEEHWLCISLSLNIKSVRDIILLPWPQISMDICESNFSLLFPTCYSVFSKKCVTHLSGENKTHLGALISESPLLLVGPFALSGCLLVCSQAWGRERGLWSSMVPVTGWGKFTSH